MTGFDSKRQMAQDKLDDDADTLTIVYQRGFADGKRSEQRKPLTDEQARDLLPTNQNHMTRADLMLWVLRATERAHGIKEKNTCVGKDPRCPCQDGDACHYKDCGNTKARPVPQAEPVCPECKAAVLYECVACSSNNYPPQQQAEMRLPKVGDKVICLEDESLGKIVSLTAGGSPDILFDDGSHGTYLLREFAELFGYAEQRQQQAELPPEWPLIKNILAVFGLDAISFVAKWQAAQRPWQGLTDDEICEIHNASTGKNVGLATGMVEAKLKERNT